MNAASGKVHFVGVAGAGMSALAQFHAMSGGAASGSDRGFDAGRAGALRAKLEALGVRLFAQTGAGVDADVAEVVASTAIETDNKDLERARTLGLGIVHRADWLARLVKERKTIAVTGTSGKSTVVAMIFEILEGAGRSPSVITGGGLRALERRGLVGNAWRGESDLLVVEADESDGTVTQYEPWLGVLLNVSRDHKEIAELQSLFDRFREHCSTFLDGAGGSRAEAVELGPDGSVFTVEGARFTVPVPGRHNVDNALAALAACRRAGVGLGEAARALAAFQGVARRFERVGEAGGVQVVDDFAHNPVKVRAALAAAHLRAGRVLAVFQPHGYAPTRFNLAGFVDSFAETLAGNDVLWLPEIYYAGGTAQKTVSAKDIADAVAARGRDARFRADRRAVLEEAAAEARPGDLVLVMGARDPSLPEFARDLLKALIHKLSTGA